MLSVGGKAMNCRPVYRTTPTHNSYNDDYNNKKNEKHLTIQSAVEYNKSSERF